VHGSKSVETSLDAADTSVRAKWLIQIPLGAGVKSVRNLGNASLLVAVSGLVAVEAALRLHWVGGPAWYVVGRAFEASTVGGVADWFAVTALFREVPLPVIRRHTNIIAKNRARIVKAIADMVQNRWLSPEVIREHLNRFSASQQLLERLSDETDAQVVLSFLRDLFRKLTGGIDRPEVSGFLERSLKDQLKSIDLAGPLGLWMATAIRRGDHQAIWDTVLSSLEQAMQGTELREVLGRVVDRAIQEYREGGFLQGVTVQAAETLRLFKKDQVVDALSRRLEQWVEEAQGNPDHPLRQRLNAILLDFADGLAAGRPESLESVEKIQRALVEAADTKEYIANALHRLRESVDSELSTDGSDLDQLIRRIFREQLMRFRSDDKAQAALDAWIRNVATEIVEDRHAQIGVMVRGSLEKLSDLHLVAQIEEKVGADLQYIRLNGAVVGGLVGAILAIAKLLL
jgi:uncharacterized membrane-anchored protein YjiN (DUF445 family)